MGQGVFTRRKVGFVDKSLSEVGAGKTFPMEVTGATVPEKLDKIAEIYYRVKDASFIEGYERITIGALSYDITASTTAPSNRSIQTDATTYQHRGFTKPGTSAYYGAEYDAGFGTYFSDIGDMERGIYIGPHWASSPAGLVANAFHFTADDPNNNHVTDSNWFNSRGAVGVRAEVRWGNQIAIVKDDPADGFFKSTNRFFLELEFYYYDYDSILNFGASTCIDGSYAGDPDDPSYVTEICNYVIRLSSGDLTCPIYAGNLGADSVTGSDFVHKGGVWWPYAKDDPATPVWDSGTGALL